MRVRLTRRSFLALAAGLACATAVTALRDTWAPEVTEVELGLGLGLTVMVVTDLHLHGWGWREEAVLDALIEASRRADVAVVLGDTYDQATPSLELVERMLKPLDLPKLGVLGNHEHWATGRFPLQQGIAALEAAGVRLLLNEAVELKGVKFGGIDWYEDEAGLPRSYLSRVGEVDVLLSHTPDVAGLSPRARVVLAGHTHGGQVCLPLLGPLWVPSRYGARFASGLFRLSESYLYVSRGLGESVLPVRINCRRELPLIHL